MNHQIFHPVVIFAIIKVKPWSWDVMHHVIMYIIMYVACMVESTVESLSQLTLIPRLHESTSYLWFVIIIAIGEA